MENGKLVKGKLAGVEMPRGILLGSRPYLQQEGVIMNDLPPLIWYIDTMVFLFVYKCGVLSTGMPHSTQNRWAS